MSVILIELPESLLKMSSFCEGLDKESESIRLGNLLVNQKLWSYYSDVISAAYSLRWQSERKQIDWLEENGHLQTACTSINQLITVGTMTVNVTDIKELFETIRFLQMPEIAYIIMNSCLQSFIKLTISLQGFLAAKQDNDLSIDIRHEYIEDLFIVLMFVQKMKKRLKIDMSIQLKEKYNRWANEVREHAPYLHYTLLKYVTTFKYPSTNAMSKVKQLPIFEPIFDPRAVAKSLSAFKMRSDDDVMLWIRVVEFTREFKTIYRLGDTKTNFKDFMYAKKLVSESHLEPVLYKDMLCYFLPNLISKFIFITDTLNFMMVTQENTRVYGSLSRAMDDVVPLLSLFLSCSRENIRDITRNMKAGTVESIFWLSIIRNDAFSIEKNLLEDFVTFYEWLVLEPNVQKNDMAHFMALLLDHDRIPQLLQLMQLRRPLLCTQDEDSETLHFLKMGEEAQKLIFTHAIPPHFHLLAKYIHFLILFNFICQEVADDLAHDRNTISSSGSKLENALEGVQQYYPSRFEPALMTIAEKKNTQEVERLIVQLGIGDLIESVLPTKTAKRKRS